jgi:predicted 2-oxoglutarate/Fe(II)-dependent dioxygenase YbiX/peroxiredoxin
MRLTVGDPVPWFETRASGRDHVRFDSAAGRYIVLSLLGSMALPRSRAFLEAVQARRMEFDFTRAIFLGLSIDPADESEGRAVADLPRIGFLWDFERAISTQLGALPDGTPTGAAIGAYRPYTVVTGPDLRVIRVFGFDEPGKQAAALFDFLAGLPDLADESRVERHAPVLILPNVFEPAFCRFLIDAYERNGGKESGFMIERDGMTVGRIDHAMKSRSDHEIEDEGLRTNLRARLARRLIPEVKKCFQFTASRVERHMVACYDAATHGFFRAHRDDTTRGTAHRRFALTINLNAEDHDGGDLRFPEFGRRTYRAPTGGAVVFSCSLLHEATPVTSGKRYAYLPFLYDEEAAKLREENRRFLDPNHGKPAASP